MLPDERNDLNGRCFVCIIDFVSTNDSIIHCDNNILFPLFLKTTSEEEKTCIQFQQFITSSNSAIYSGSETHLYIKMELFN